MVAEPLVDTTKCSLQGVVDAFYVPVGHGWECVDCKLDREYHEDNT